jgi:hypothetical protein
MIKARWLRKCHFRSIIGRTKRGRPLSEHSESVHADNWEIYSWFIISHVQKRCFSGDRSGQSGPGGPDPNYSSLPTISSPGAFFSRRPLVAMPTWRHLSAGERSGAGKMILLSRSPILWWFCAVLGHHVRSTWGYQNQQNHHTGRKFVFEQENNISNYEFRKKWANWENSLIHLPCQVTSHHIHRAKWSDVRAFTNVHITIIGV